MSKELWIEAYEKFVEDNDGRRPTDEEMRRAYEDYMASLIDAAMNSHE